MPPCRDSVPGKLKLIHCQVEISKKMNFGGAHVCGLALLAMGGRPKKFFLLKPFSYPGGGYWISIQAFQMDLKQMGGLVKNTRK